MRKIKVYNKETISIKELYKSVNNEYQQELPEDMTISMKDKYIVYLNDIGYAIKTTEEVIQYANNLMVANPELDYGFNHVENINDADYVISNTLDNEEVIEFVDNFSL